MPEILYKNLYIEIFKKCTTSSKCNLALSLYPNEIYLLGLLENNAWCIFAEQGNLFGLKLLVLYNIVNDKFISIALSKTCKNNFLHIVKWITEKFPHIKVHANIMNSVASKGYLNLLKYMNEIRKDDCTKSAITNAANNGHLDIVKYLYENRKDGCRPNTISNLLSKCKKSEIINYILSNEPNIKFTNEDYDNIIEHEYMDLLKYIPNSNITETHIRNKIKNSNNIKLQTYLICNIPYPSYNLIHDITDFSLKSKNDILIEHLFSELKYDDEKKIIFYRILNNNNLELYSHFQKKYKFELSLNLHDLHNSTNYVEYEKLNTSTIDYIYEYYRKHMIKNIYGHYTGTLQGYFINIIIDKNIIYWNNNSENIFKHLINKKYIKLTLHVCGKLLEACDYYYKNNKETGNNIKRILLELMPDF